jgi:gamma-glutamyltranspeptidase/glutathione hydrolase
VVAAPHPLASQAGVAVLRRGGTAVDAAIAAGATLAVVYPHMTGLGGDSFWLCWDGRARRLRGLAACGPAARLATPALYGARGLRAIPARGPLAALTVPGAVDGLWQAHGWSREALGSPLAWADLLADAIRHAADGIPVSACQARVSGRAADLLGRAREPGFAAFRETYLTPGGVPPACGARLVQPGLAGTLERLAREGGRAFYEGAVAADIGRACEAVGSPLRAVDLAAYRARWVEPLTVPYRGGLAASLPPPSQGIAVLAILGMLDGLDVGGSPDGSADYVHLLVEATKLAFGDRDRWLADPDAAPVPVDRLLDPAYLRERAKRIRADVAAQAPVPSGVGDTVACVAADAAGNCVSLIQSLYHEWGSGVVAGETGVVLQNRGAFFSLDPAHPNALAPGKRPFHTLTPFMWLRDGQPGLVAGTMGGEGQPQTLAAVTTRVLDAGRDVQAAVEAPRWLYGRTWGAPTRALSLEGRFGARVAADLEERGHPVTVLDGWSDTLGHAQAIWRDPATGLLTGGGDPRADGPALGA